MPLYIEMWRDKKFSTETLVKTDSSFQKCPLTISSDGKCKELIDWGRLNMCEVPTRNRVIFNIRRLIVPA